MDLDERNPDSFDELTRELRADITRRGVDHHTAEDVVQEIWLRSFQRGMPEGNLRGWLHVVAARIVLNLRRSQEHRLLRERRAAKPDSVREQKADEDSALLNWVRQLPSPYGEVVQLRYLEGLEFDEIARRLGRPQTTVRSQLKRGLERLRSKMEVKEKASSRSKRGIFAGWFGLRGTTRFAGPPRALRFSWAGAILVAVLAIGSVLWRTTGTDRVGASPGAPLANTRTDPVLRGAEADGRVAWMGAPPETPSKDARQGFPRLVGTVLDPLGHPVAGAMVYLGSAESAETSPAAITDEAGHYAIDEVDPDQFVWASASRWSNSRVRYLDSLPAHGSIDMSLEDSKGSLNLVILDPDGYPVEGARVLLDDPWNRVLAPFLSKDDYLEFPPCPRAGTTDLGGRVVLPRPAARILAIQVENRGHPTWRGELAPDVGEFVEVRLPRPAALEGRVLDGKGRAALSGWVEVVQGREQAALVRTEADGTFRVDELAPGAFVVRAWQDLARSNDSCRIEGVLAAGEHRTIELRLSAAYTIHGRAIGAPAGAIVTAESEERFAQSEDSSSTRVDADGRFVLPGCERDVPYRLRLTRSPHGPPCAWQLHVRPGGEEQLLCARPGGSLVIVFEGGENARLPTKVELRRGDLPTSIIAAVDPLTGEAKLQDLPDMEFRIFAWIPGLGSWSAGTVQVAQDSHEELRLAVPRVARLTIQAQVPFEQLDVVEAYAIMQAFNAHGFVARGHHTLKRELSFDEHGDLVADLLPGQYGYVMRCAGAADILGSVRVEEGVDLLERVVVEPGVHVEIGFRYPRSTAKAERVRLIARTADGRHLVIDMRETEAPREAWIPLNTVELMASSSSMKGSVLVPSLVQDSPDFLQRFEIPLMDAPVDRP